MSTTTTTTTERARRGNEIEMDALRQSCFPHQFNDYVLLTLPLDIVEFNKHSQARICNKSSNGLTAACDYKLVSLVQMLWSYNIITHGWHQGSPQSEDDIYGPSGFILCQPISTNGKKVDELLLSLFGEENIVKQQEFDENVGQAMFDEGMTNEEINQKAYSYEERRAKYQVENAVKFHDKIRLIQENEESSRLTIEFNYELLPWIHSKLGLSLLTVKDPEVVRGCAFFHCSRRTGCGNFFPTTGDVPEELWREDGPVLCSSCTISNKK